MKIIALAETPRTDEARDTCRNCNLDFVLASDMEAIERELTNLRNIATDALEFIEDRADVNADGTGPNHAMSLAQDLRSALKIPA